MLSKQNSTPIVVHNPALRVSDFQSSNQVNHLLPQTLPIIPHPSLNPHKSIVNQDTFNLQTSRKSAIVIASIFPFWIYAVSLCPINVEFVLLHPSLNWCVTMIT